jgi:hypothetical protein
MSKHAGLYCPDGSMCKQNCTERIQRCRHDKQFIRDLLDPATTIDSLRARIAELEQSEANLNELMNAAVESQHNPYCNAFLGVNRNSGPWDF